MGACGQFRKFPAARVRRPRLRGGGRSSSPADRVRPAERGPLSNCVVVLRDGVGVVRNPSWARAASGGGRGGGGRGRQQCAVSTLLLLRSHGRKKEEYLVYMDMVVPDGSLRWRTCRSYLSSPFARLVFSKKSSSEGSLVVLESTRVATVSRLSLSGSFLFLIERLDRPVVRVDLSNASRNPPLGLRIDARTAGRKGASRH